MRTAYDAVYLSPHLDDVALSCGGQIAQQTAVGRSVLIVTIAAGGAASAPLSELGQHLHQQWQLQAANGHDVRRQEDVAACRSLKADYIHWDVPDAIYRRHPFTQAPLYGSIEELAKELHSIEASLITAIVRRLQNLPAHDRLFAPLAVGNHVDHQLVRLAAEYCFGMQISYYEDYPYAQIPGLLAETLQETTWHSEVIELTKGAVATKLTAVACFASQIEALFHNWGNAETLMQTYMNDVGGERIWQRISH